MKYVKLFEGFLAEAAKPLSKEERASMIEYIVNSEDDIEAGLLDAIGDEIDRKGDNTAAFKKALEKTDDKKLKSIYKDVMNSVNEKKEEEEEEEDPGTELSNTTGMIATAEVTEDKNPIVAYKEEDGKYYKQNPTGGKWVEITKSEYESKK